MNLFFKNQFGFLKSRSTGQALVKIINFITKKLNEGKVEAVWFGKSQNVENACVRGIALNWVKSYLSDRKQRVRIGTTISETIEDIIKEIRTRTHARTHAYLFY